MGRRQQVSVLGQFLETVERDGLLPHGSRVLVAVSGGADSVCLLDLLRVAARRLELKLFGFHMNHGLRPAAGRDERFVRALFGSDPVTVVRSDVAGYARRHKMGLEEAGRELRYRHMERVCRKLGCDRVALGHTADDNLETMLLNLARGAGLSGLSGIPVQRGVFVRPLLGIEHSRIVQYLRARRLAWTEDETNQDTRFKRNLIRLQAVPALKQANPAAAASAARAARLLAQEDEFLESLAREALARVATLGKRTAFIDCRAFASYNVCLKRRMVRQLLPRLDFDAVARTLEFLRQGPDATLILSSRVRLVRKSGVARVPIQDR